MKLHQAYFLNSGKLVKITQREIVADLPDWRMISPVAACMIFAVLVQTYAGFALRGAYADGAYQSTRMAAHRGFVLFQSSRLMSKIIDEAPAVAAIKFGLGTPHDVALIFSLSTNILPGLLMLLCFPALPPDKKQFLIFPALVYFAGTLSAQFASVAEGLIATAYFWFLLCLIAFGRLTPLRLGLILMLAAGTIRLHEEMIFLGPVLAISCAVRWQNEPRALPRAVLLLTAFFALASAAVAAHYILHPDAGASERDGYIAQFRAFYWIYLPGSGLNLPCVLAIMAMLYIFVAVLWPASGKAVTWIFAAFSVPLALGSFWFECLTSPGAQFCARYNDAFISLPLALVFLLLVSYAPSTVILARRPIYIIVALLGFTASLWHISATQKWSAFITHFNTVLKSQDGIIKWNAVISPPGSQMAILSNKMLWIWTNPDLSLVALKRSCIKSIIDNPPITTWQPYNLQNIATMPVIQGLTYAYLVPQDRQIKACSGGRV